VLPIEDRILAANRPNTALPTPHRDSPERIAWAKAKLGAAQTARINGRPDWKVSGDRETLSDEKIAALTGGSKTSEDSRNRYPAQQRPRRAAAGSQPLSVMQLKAKAARARRDCA
jgi:hypothetical protein